MAFVALWCLILLAGVLPGLWPRTLALAEYPPDPWLIFLVYVAMRGRGFTAVGWGILLGIVRDALSLDPLGTYAFVLGTAGFLFCEGRRQRAPIEGGARLVATCAATLVAAWLYVLRGLPMGNGLRWGDVFAAVPTALWTTVVAAGLFPIFDHFRLFDELMGRHRGVPA